MKKKNPVGAPRTVSPDPENMIDLGEEMLLWVKNHPETIHLSEWYTIEKGFIYKDWKTFIQKKEFIPYYERALKLIGLNYIKKDTLIEPNIKARWQRVYFGDLREQEDEDLKNKIELESKQKTDVPVLSNQVDLENELMLLRAENAKLKKKLNID